MATYPPSPSKLPANDAEAPASLPRDRVLDERWRLEQQLLLARWLAIVTWAVLIPFISVISRPLAFAIVIAIACGNGVVWRLLRRNSTRSGLRTAQHTASGVEWIGAALVMGVSSDHLALVTPGILLILVLISGVRYRSMGVAVATLVASLIAIASFVWHIGVRASLPASEAVWPAAIWLIHIKVMGLVTLILVRRGDALRLQEAAQHEAQLAGYERERSGLSEREWRVLELVVADLTDRQIADRLSIAPSTVRTHLQHIAEKLDVRARRPEIKRRVQELGLFYSDDADS